MKQPIKNNSQKLKKKWPYTQLCGRYDMKTKACTKKQTGWQNFTLRIFSAMENADVVKHNLKNHVTI